jgi:nuclear transcription Y subunit beta
MKQLKFQLGGEKKSETNAMQNSNNDDEDETMTDEIHQQPPPIQQQETHMISLKKETINSVIITPPPTTPTTPSSSIDSHHTNNQLLYHQFSSVYPSTIDDSTQDLNEPVFELREQDRFLPIANIHKIMKKALPPNNKIKISKEAKETMQECVSEFISFITSEASDHCVVEKRKTITGDDLLTAMQALGFDNYVDLLRSYLYKYRDNMNQDKGTKRKPSLPSNTS